MNTNSLLEDLISRGFKLSAEEGKLRVSSDESPLTDSDRQIIKKNKQEILKLISELTANEQRSANGVQSQPEAESHSILSESSVGEDKERTHPIPIVETRTIFTDILCKVCASSLIMKESEDGSQTFCPVSKTHYYKRKDGNGETLWDLGDRYQEEQRRRIRNRICPACFVAQQTKNPSIPIRTTLQRLSPDKESYKCKSCGIKYEIHDYGKVDKN
ncbi:MAG: hypothetical protein L0220_29190 [Acidobacteria bacterium]|nr:hypothetical protein [Acidobacteriota bacterium]